MLIVTDQLPGALAGGVGGNRPIHRVALGKEDLLVVAVNRGGGEGHPGDSAGAAALKQLQGPGNIDIMLEQGIGDQGANPGHGGKMRHHSLPSLAKGTQRPADMEQRISPLRTTSALMR